MHVGEPLEPSGMQIVPDGEKYTYVGEPIEDEPTEGDDLDKAGVADKESFKHVGDDAEEQKLGEEFLRIAWGHNLPESFAGISEDANEALVRLKNQTVSAQDAMKVLKDMVSYIQGAMEAFKGVKVDSGKNDMQHVGTQPKASTEKPVKPTEHGDYVGAKGNVKDQKEKPVDATKDIQHVGTDPKAVTEKPSKAEADLQHVGKEPKANTQKPVQPSQVNHVGENPYEKPSGEVPVLK